MIVIATSHCDDCHLGTQAERLMNNEMASHCGSGALSVNTGPGEQHNASITGGGGNNLYSAREQTINYNSAPPTRGTDKFEALRRSMFLSDPWIDRNNLIQAKGERVQGTCEWIQKIEAYEAWLTGQTDLLWICGAPGTGKTMLSIYLTQTLEKAHCVIYYFFSSQDETRNSLTAVLRALIWQVSRRCKEATHQFPRCLENLADLAEVLLSVETLWVIFLEMIQGLGARQQEQPVYCLLDGLDECNDQAIRWLCSKLMNAANSMLRVAVISRHIAGLKGATQILIDDQQITGDVKSFISSRMHTLATCLELGSDVRNHIQAILLQKSGDTFLWAGFAMDELSELGTSVEVIDTIDKMPRGLPALYDRMLARIQSRKRTKSTSILRWVALAYRTLSLHELAAAVNCYSQGPLSSGDVIRDELKICAPLLEIRGKEVVMVHHSAREYLLGGHVHRQGILSTDMINGEDAIFALAQRCIQSLSSEDALWLYASLHWVDHANALVTLGETLVRLENSFFGEHSRMRDLWWGLVHEYWSRPEYLPRLHLAYHFGFHDWAKLILSDKTDLVDPNERDCEGHTPLHYAISSHENYTISQSLLCRMEENWSNNSVHFQQIMRDAGYETGLHTKTACRSPSRTEGATGITYTTIHSNIIGGQQMLSMVKVLLEFGADANIPCELGITPLAEAALLQDANLVKLLAKNGADPNQKSTKDHYFSTPPLAADDGGHQTLHRNPRYLILVERGWSTLHMAAFSGNVPVTRSLIEYGAQVNAESETGATPLAIALQQGHTSVAEILRSHNAREPNGDMTNESYNLYSCERLFPADQHAFGHICPNFCPKSQSRARIKFCCDQWDAAHPPTPATTDMIQVEQAKTGLTRARSLSVD